jgi:DNA-binding MarR family transcriptional regulator
MRASAIQSSVSQCAGEVLETVPLVMRVIRGQLRKYGAKEVSVPHFRTLGYLNRHEGTSLSEVAEHIGLSLPSMSELIDGLVVRGLVFRRTHPEDRRRMTLALSDSGRATLRTANEATASYLEARFRELSTVDRGKVIEAMHILREAFTKAID